MSKKNPMVEVRAGILTDQLEKIERLTAENKDLADALEAVREWTCTEITSEAGTHRAYNAARALAERRGE